VDEDIPVADEDIPIVDEDIPVLPLDANGFPCYNVIDTVNGNIRER